MDLIGLHNVKDCISDAFAKTFYFHISERTRYLEWYGNPGIGPRPCLAPLEISRCFLILGHLLTDVVLMVQNSALDQELFSTKPFFYQC